MISIALLVGACAQDGDVLASGTTQGGDASTSSPGPTGPTSTATSTASTDTTGSVTSGPTDTSASTSSGGSGSTSGLTSGMTTGTTGGACEGLAEDVCAERPACMQVYGNPYVMMDMGWCLGMTPEYLGCMVQMGCGDFPTNVCDDVGNDPYLLPDTCVPPGFSECNAPPMDNDC